MALTQEDRAVLEQARDNMVVAVRQELAENEPKVAAQIEQSIKDAWANAETPADIAASFTKLQESTQTAVNDLKAKLDEQSARRWHNDDDRLRAQGGRYDGTPVELLPIMQQIAQEKSLKGIGGPYGGELAAVNDTIDQTLKNIGKDGLAAHSAALKRRVAERHPGFDSVLQSLEDQSLERIPLRQPTEPGIVLQTLTTVSNPAEGQDPPSFWQPSIDATMWADMRLLPGGVMNRIPSVSMRGPQHYMTHFDDLLIDALEIGSPNTGGGNTGTQTSATGDTDPNRRRPLLQAATIRLATSVSQDEMEDSVVNLAAALRDEMMQAGQYGLDNMLLNADDTVAASNAAGTTGNINGARGVNNMSGLPNQHGIRYYCIVEESGNQRVNANGALSHDHFLSARGLLLEAGVEARDFFYVCAPRLYSTILGITEFERYDAAERLASLITGRVDLAYGTPIVVSPSFPANVTAEGRIASTGAGNVTDSVAAVVGNLWRLGVYVPFQLQSGQGLAVTGSTINPDGMNFFMRGRYAVQHRNTTGVNHTRPAALIRNITRS